MSSSLNTSALLLTPFGRETTKTKNHDVKNVPMISSNVAKCGNTDGLMGDTYRVNDSIFSCLSLKLPKYKMRILLSFRLFSVFCYSFWNEMDEISTYDSNVCD